MATEEMLNDNPAIQGEGDSIGVAKPTDQPTVAPQPSAPVPAVPPSATPDQAATTDTTETDKTAQSQSVPNQDQPTPQAQDDKQAEQVGQQNAYTVPKQDLLPKQDLPQPTPPPNSDPTVQHAGKLMRLAEIMAGGPKFTYEVNDQGQMVRTKQRLTGGQIAMGIIAAALGGMEAGSDKTNPAAAFAAGANSAIKQRQAQDQAERQQATTEFMRKAAVVENNFKTYQNQMTALRLGWDANQIRIDSNKELYGQLQTLTTETGSSAVVDVLDQYQLQDKIKSDPEFTSRYNFIPVSQDFETDSNGKPVMTSVGPALHTKYAVVDPNVLAKIPSDLKLKNSKGEDVKLPADLKLKVSTLVGLIENKNGKQNFGIAFNKLKDPSYGNKKTDTDTDKDTPKTKVTPDTPVAKAYTDSTGNFDPNALSSVMADHESGGKPDARSIRNNNPGNIMGKGDTGKSDAQGFAVYSTPEAGKQAQHGLLQRVVAAHPNITLNGLINGEDGYAGYASSKAPGNSDETAQNYVNDLTKHATDSPQGLDAVPDKYKLDFAVPSDDDWEKLPQSAKQLFQKTHGDLGLFFDGPKNGQSTMQHELSQGKITPEAYGSLVNLIRSEDGKFTGQAAVDEQKRLTALHADVEQKEAEARAADKIKRESRNPEVEAAAEQLIKPNNLATLKDIGGMSTEIKLQIFARAQEMAKKQNIPFDIGLVGQRAKYIGQYENASGSAYKNRNAINNMMQHAADLATVDNEYRSKGASGIQLLNTPVNQIRKTFGDADYIKYSTTLGVLKEEAKLFFAGGYAPTKQQEEMWNKIVDEKATPAQIEAFSKEIINLGLRRASTFNSEFKKMMGYDDPDMITPDARRAAQFLSSGNDMSSQLLRNNLDKFASGGQYGDPTVGYKPPVASPDWASGKVKGSDGNMYWIDQNHTRVEMVK